jgi:CCR4-NOT transcription complex subunit 1
VVQPDTNVQDRVHFVFNNLSNTNLEAKEKDLLGSLGEQYIPWLIHYIVIKRAAQEQNYLTLYLQFVDRLDRKLSKLLKGVVSCTIDNIKILLADDKVTSSSSVRSLLKNLGSWLGMLTIQRNKPILQRDLDLKALLIDAYEKGRLIAVVPFVAKILETCNNSRIFYPPNPWTMLILSLLAELHPLDDLKLNIKFEVEVLCKSLNKELKDIRPSNVLVHRKTVKEGNPDWSSRVANSGLDTIKPLPSIQDSRLMDVAARMAAQSAAPAAMVAPQGSVPIVGQQADVSGVVQQPAGSQPLASADIDLNVANYITINHSIAIFQQYPHFTQAVVQAVSQVGPENSRCCRS